MNRTNSTDGFRHLDILDARLVEGVRIGMFDHASVNFGLKFKDDDEEWSFGRQICWSRNVPTRKKQIAQGADRQKREMHGERQVSPRIQKVVYFEQVQPRSSPHSIPVWYLRSLNPRTISIPISFPIP